MFTFLDSAIPEDAIGAIHQVIATLRGTYADPTGPEIALYRRALRSIERAEKTEVELLLPERRESYIARLEKKQRQLSKRQVSVDERLGRELLEGLREDHRIP